MWDAPRWGLTGPRPRRCEQCRRPGTCGRVPCPASPAYFWPRGRNKPVPPAHCSSNDRPTKATLCHKVRLGFRYIHVKVRVHTPPGEPRPPRGCAGPSAALRRGVDAAGCRTPSSTSAQRLRLFSARRFAASDLMPMQPGHGPRRSPAGQVTGSWWVSQPYRSVSPQSHPNTVVP